MHQIARITIRSQLVVPLTFLCVIVSMPCLNGSQQELQKNCGGLSAPGKYPDFEPTPQYTIERRIYSRSKPSRLALQISVSPSALGGSAIVRLGCKIASDFPNERKIYALIFDDKKAARRFSPGFEDQENYGLYLWHLRARYELDRDEKRHFIEYLIPVLDNYLLSIKRAKIWLSPAD